MENIKTIDCPNCGKPIDVKQAMVNHLKEEYQSKYNQKIIDVKSQYDKKYSELNAMNEILERKKEKLNDAIEKGIQQKIAIEKSKIEKNLRQRIDEEKSEEIKSYREQLQEKVLEAKNLNKLKADFERLTREKNELKEKLEVELQERLSQLVNEEKRKIKDANETQTQLKLSEKELIIQQLKDQLKSAQRKAESGSTQLQGEAQEVSIEGYLRECFPMDSITEVKKGVKGADSLQTVNIAGIENCGRILYESKRTEFFQNVWLEKFKDEVRESNANFGVLVTNVLPKDMKRFGQKNGIWICTFDEFKGLCFVLREFIVQLHVVSVTQEDKVGKMELLYSFFTGSEFRSNLEAIVEGFSSMHNDLTKEKRAMEAIWKAREKQIQKVLTNTSQMYGTIKGIAGKSILTIKSLELPGEEL